MPSDSPPRTPATPDRPPDRAALEELRRVFGVDDDPRQRGSTLDDDDPTAAADASSPGDDSEPFEFEIIEQDPLPPAEPTPPALAEPPPAAEADFDPDADADTDAAADLVDGPHPDSVAPPPTVIRIDDYRATGAADAQPTDPTHAPPSPAQPALVSDTPPGDRSLIAIDADDLPDAVYIEGSLDSGGGDSIVFIEDDADSDAFTPESERDLRRGIEPRMRERRVAVKRAQGRKRLKWVIAIVVVVLIGVGALAALGSSLFAIRDDQVTVTGAVYTNPDDLQAVVDDLVGTPVLVADTRAAELALERIPWVADAKVTVRFPHAASIEIRERQAVATFQGPDGRYRVLDADGRVLDVLDMYPFAYVLVEGPDPVDLGPGEFAPPGYQGAADLAKNLTGRVRGQVERIEVTANGSRLSMWLDDGTEVRFGEARDLFIKLVRLETLLAEECERVPGPIDVSTDETTSPGGCEPAD